MLLTRCAVRTFCANLHAIFALLHGDAAFAAVRFLHPLVWEGDQIVLVGVEATREVFKSTERGGQCIRATR